MKQPRLSISRVMLVVAAVAINLGFGRILYDFHPMLPVGMALNGFALQAAVLILFYRRSQGRRPFWAGFLACGLIAMTAFVWGMVFARNTGIGIDLGGDAWSTMKVTIVHGSVPIWSAGLERLYRVHPNACRREVGL